MLIKAKKMPRRHLPGEILTDIFLRLPFDSILNCKLVSIEWKNLINHPTFSKNYNGYINSMSLFADRDRIFCLRFRHDNKRLTKARNPRFTVNQLPIASQNDSDTFVYIQISNMIACVRKDDGAFNFYNLITGSAALHTVTDSHLCIHGWRYYGFGYDSCGDDYKIVQFCHYPENHHMSYNKTQFWVYSFKNREWKSFNEFPYSAYTSSDFDTYAGATTVNGVLHWLAPQNGALITYDLHTGVFGEIKTPEVDIGLECFHDFGLQELNGKLCYTYERKCNNRLLDVWRCWMMVGDSWEMLVSINCATADGKIPWYMLYNCERPVMLHESAEGQKRILFFDQVDGPNLHWYDFVNNKCETFCEKVWHQQRIKKRRPRTSHVVKS